MEQQTEKVQYLPHSRLETHPKNMRKVYPVENVRKMARSIKGRGRIIQPLIGVPGENGSILIVVGNLRLTAVRTLGDEAPLVPVIVRERSEEDQLLDMVVENGVRFDPDVVSEGLHYRILLDQPGMNLRRLAHETGVSLPRIKNRLAWAELEPEIQELGIEGKLPRGAAEHLPKIPDRELRVKTAKTLAAQRARLQIVEKTCIRVVVQMERRKRDEESARHEHGPAVGQAAKKQQLPGAKDRVGWEIMKKAAQQACSVCPNSKELGIVEPAWTILAHGSQDICDLCGLRKIRSYCNQCPLTRLLRRVCRELVRQDGGTPHERF